MWPFKAHLSVCRQSAGTETPVKEPRSALVPDGVLFIQWWMIAAHTSVRGSGRVGQTASGRALDEEALRAAVIAAIRHRHTHYDRLLMKGWDRMDARNAVRGDVDGVLSEWRKAVQ